jgi:serine phosphatase RsbU (regulator of sigma subunit)
MLSTLFLFSDGAYEILTRDEERWELENLLPLLMEPAVPGVTEPNRVYRKVREAAKAGPLDDDFSLIALTFP